jgi:ATP-dependent DNA ligase
MFRLMANTCEGAIDGEEMRLKRLLRRKRSRVLYIDHIEAQGRHFFDEVCELDLQGIVAKRKTAVYRGTENRRAG